MFPLLIRTFRKKKYKKVFTQKVMGRLYKVQITRFASLMLCYALKHWILR